MNAYDQCVSLVGDRERRTEESQVATDIHVLIFYLPSVSTPRKDAWMYSIGQADVSAREIVFRRVSFCSMFSTSGKKGFSLFEHIWQISLSQSDLSFGHGVCTLEKSPLVGFEGRQSALWGVSVGMCKRSNSRGIFFCMFQFIFGFVHKLVGRIHGVVGFLKKRRESSRFSSPF